MKSRTMTSLTKVELESVNCDVIKISNTTNKTDDIKVKLNKSSNKTTEGTIIDDNKSILLTKENSLQNSSDKGFLCSLFFINKLSLSYW